MCSDDILPCIFHYLLPKYDRMDVPRCPRSRSLPAPHSPYSSLLTTDGVANESGIAGSHVQQWRPSLPRPRHSKDVALWGGLIAAFIVYFASYAIDTEGKLYRVPVDGWVSLCAQYEAGPCLEDPGTCPCNTVDNDLAYLCLVSPEVKGCETCVPITNLVQDWTLSTADNVLVCDPGPAAVAAVVIDQGKVRAAVLILALMVIW